ncbi:MAG: lipopolysaccharide export system protein LptA [Bermanella sp.]|jgi:lipopolysaccharide export system protein LptA
MIQRLSNILITLTLASVSLTSWALPDDSEQEIRIASDTASLDKIRGEIIYSGNVNMQQGSLNIQAQTLTLIRTTKGLQKIIATGTPARYEQTLSANEGKTLAYGETIIYDTNIEELTLLNNAGLEKQGNVFSGEKIVYLIKEQRVKAESPEQQNRIRMVIQPKKDKES